MENRNYKVNIKDIYVGDVCGINPRKIELKEDGTYCNLDDDEELAFYWAYLNRQHYWKQKNQLFYDVGCNHWGVSFNRSMLFTLDEKRHANDLLYASPHYPILNMSKNEDCLNEKICICMQTYQLYELLKYYNYPNTIGYEDVLEIRNTFFNYITWNRNTH